MGKHRKYTQETFWNFVGPKNDEGCMCWTEKATEDGYGALSLYGKSCLAHRIAFMLHHKIPISPTQHVCHKCDNPPCCNPEHLFLGNASINMQDMWNKRRHVRPVGETNNHAVLTKEKVIEIRAKYSAGGIGQVALGKEYGVSQANIGCIVNRHTWTHI